MTPTLSGTLALAGHSRANVKNVTPANTIIMSFPCKRESRGVMKAYYIYILASKRNGTLYIGVTNDIVRRVYEHKNSLIAGFTSKYSVNTLVYCEQFDDIESAIQREKQIKKWNRRWKLELIERANPDWRDLYNDLV
jgi:putative endonuclease